MLRGIALGVAAPALTTTPAASASAAPAPASAPAAGDRTSRAAAGAASGATAAASFRWLGTSGWRIDSGGRTLLFDPYLTRYDTGLFSGAFDDRTRLRTDERLVREHAGEPAVVLVSHSHWDHINDVPHIARTTGARVVGTETTYHLLRSLGVAADRLVVVRGGEVLDFDGWVVEVAASRHSRNSTYGYFAPGTLNAPPARAPRTIGELPEGDTLAFQVTPPGGPTAFLMGGSDFSERDTEGLRPDLAMVAVPGGGATHRYLPRLLAALGHPRTVVPVHWDNFETPLADPAEPAPGVDLADFAARVREESPAAQVVVPEYLTPYDWSRPPV
ncbi:MAG TPA: MBL fold metallo-hydrolase [Streptomyces sp.]|nr:MBL fold metallo-hydrolase [Streptomyces sp.]